MKQSLKWITDAISTKDITHGMSHYKIAERQIRATNGRLIAAHPWPADGSFVVPGDEFEKLVGRMPEEPTIKINDNSITVRAGRYHGTINTLAPEAWIQPGVDEAEWKKLPPRLLLVLRALRPFVSDNAMQPWADCIALENNWSYATNNIALAGAPCPGLGKIMALLPSWAVDFILTREEGITDWAWTANYVAFRWQNNAWLRSTLVIGQFPERAAELVRSSLDEKPSQEISDDFRKAFNSVAHMAEDTIELYADKIVARFKQAEVIAEIECEVPDGCKCSIWGATYLVPAINAATHWQPSLWPKPVPFKGDMVSGYVVGRRQ
jgi:hypothetical protein